MPINGQIKEKEVQLIGVNGEKVGVVSIEKAMELAEENNMDLVLVAPNSKPVVCRLMNYGKYKFEQYTENNDDIKDYTDLQEAKEENLPVENGVENISIFKKIKNFFATLFGNKIRNKN